MLHLLPLHFPCSSGKNMKLNDPKKGIEMKKFLGTVCTATSDLLQTLKGESFTALGSQQRRL